MTYVVQHDTKLALQHQMTIIECLDHSDFTIKREVQNDLSYGRNNLSASSHLRLMSLFAFLSQTLELLFRITNAQNVTVIVEKMLDFLRVCSDDHTIIHLVGKVAELAEKYPFSKLPIV